MSNFTIFVLIMVAAVRVVGAPDPIPSLKTEFEALRAEATRLAGRPTDIAQRVVFLHDIFLESGRLHAFPEIALHGALWAHQFFSRKNLLKEVMISPQPKLSQSAWLKKIDQFSQSLLKANRQVFIDTYANFYFSQKFGTHPDASKFVPQRLLDLLNRVHSLTPTARLLPYLQTPETRSLQAAAFDISLREEQEKTVGPLISQAVRDLCPKQDRGCRFSRQFLLKPVVRFGYFPRDQRSFFFDDFSRADERIFYALLSFDIATRVGWDNVEQTLTSYAVDFSQEFLTSPQEFARRLKARLLAKPTQSNPE